MPDRGDRGLRWWECTRKRAWQSEYVAGNVATALSWRADHSDDLEAYRCRWCGLWHVGHDRTRPRR